MPGCPLPTAPAGNIGGLSGIITTVTDNLTLGYSGDGRQALSAQMSSPAEVALDASGNVYIVDQDGNRVKKVTAGGSIPTVAGYGSPGFSGDEAGNLYIADAMNSRTRKVDVSGNISTIVGTGTASCSGDGGPATAAMLHRPVDVLVKAGGELIVADSFNNRIRMVVH